MKLPFEENPLITQRLTKLEQLRARGVDPYPRRFVYTHTLAQLTAEYESLDHHALEQQQEKQVAACGRIVAMRGFGKAAFLQIAEGGGRIQVYIKKDQISPEDFEIFQLLDVGDILGVEGPLFRTKTGELTILVKKLVLLAKGLLPLPEKWHGLTDVELRYRQRYLDLTVNPEVRKTFLLRSRIIQELRRFLDDRRYIEVETPMMHPIAGGATAKPFKTFHNALGMPFYLRIAPELYLKRLIVGGMERVYEINRNFRNEGLSTQHNPEFTMVEFYQAYSDFRDLMTLTEEMLTQLAVAITGSKEFPFNGNTISFEKWYRFTLKEAIRHFWCTGRGPVPEESDLKDRAKLEQYLHAYGEAVPKDSSAGELLGLLFETVAERQLIQPTFIYDYPVELSPLSKKRPDDPSIVERFELYIGGFELANAYSELNDPLDQFGRFEEQVRNRDKGDEEAHEMDEDYVRALAYGMPPTAGEGIGIDRLVMLLTDSRSIRDVILFPHMRPEQGRAAEENAKDSGGQK